MQKNADPKQLTPVSARGKAFINSHKLLHDRRNSGLYGLGSLMRAVEICRS
jgi:hypothetical protein